MEKRAIGDIDIDPGLGRVRRGEAIAAIEPKPMNVLIFLAQSSGETCKRDDLLAACWPARCVGEDALNRAVYQVRKALREVGSSAQVLTVPKVGYRLELSEDRAMHETTSAVQDLSTQEATPLRGIARRPALGVVLAAASMLALVLIAGPVQTSLSSAPTRAVASIQGPSLEPVSLSPRFGESDPSFSADGTKLAAIRESGEGFELVVRTLSGSMPERTLWTAPTRLVAPAWSTDGDRIAFISVEASDACSIHSVSITAPGAPTRIASCATWKFQRLDWNDPEGALILSDLDFDGVRRVMRVAADGARSVLTNPGDAIVGDALPVLSPDGTRLAFLREKVWRSGDVFVLTLADGELRRVTHDARDVAGIAWAPDGKSLYVSSDRRDDKSVWRFAIDGKSAPQRVTIGADVARRVATSPTGSVAVETGAERSELVFVSLKPPYAARQLEPGVAGLNEHPEVNPLTGETFFITNRTGARELWAMTTSGETRPAGVQLPGRIESLRLSPQGDAAVVTVLRNGNRDVIRVTLESKEVEIIAAGPDDQFAAGWNASGEIAYIANGVLKIKGVSLKDIAAWRPTQRNEVIASRLDEPGLWIINPSTEQVRPFSRHRVHENGWDVYGDKIAFIDKATGDVLTGNIHSGSFSKLPLETPLGIRPTSLSFSQDGEALIMSMMYLSTTRIQVFSERDRPS